MNREQCIERLRDIEQSIGSEAENISVLVRVGEQFIRVCTYTGTIEAYDTDKMDPLDPCFAFSSWQQVFEILSGEIDFSSAFLNGQIRSNGYLTIVFPLMAMFQRQRSTVPPD